MKEIVDLQYTECPIILQSQENSVIWQYMEKFKEGEAVNHVVLMSNVGYIYLELAVMALSSLYY